MDLFYSKNVGGFIIAITCTETYGSSVELGLGADMR